MFIPEITIIQQSRGSGKLLVLVVSKTLHFMTHSKNTQIMTSITLWLLQYHLTNIYRAVYLEQVALTSLQQEQVFQ